MSLRKWPQETELFSFDLRDRLEDDEELLTSDFTLGADATATLGTGARASTFGEGVTSFWLSGGEPGEVVEVINSFTTSHDPARILREVGAVHIREN